MSVLNTQIPLHPSATQIIHNHITVQTAAELTGYNAQYLRRLMRSGTLEGLKIGQTWLIEWNSLAEHVIHGKRKIDHRCGPRFSKAKGQEWHASTNVNTSCLQTYTHQEE